jgi:DNA-binding transcriptional MerR regulator
MSAISAQLQEPRYRIGELAERVGVTPRTIRYYEELGLLGGRDVRSKGAHRTYTEADALRLRELLRLRDLLGLSLDELVQLAEAEEARAALREQWHEQAGREQRLRIIEEAIPHVERQLALVRARRQTLAEFEAQLQEKLESLERRRRSLAGPDSGTST